MSGGAARRVAEPDTAESVEEQERPAAAEPAVADELPLPFRVLRRVCDTVVIAIMVGQFGILLADVIGRVAAHGFYISSTQEISQITMVMVAFLGAVSAHLRGQHVAMHLVQSRLPARLRPVGAAVTEAITAATAFFVGWQSIGMVRNAQGDTTPVLHVSLVWQYIAIPIGMFLIGIVSTYRLVRLGVRNAILGVGVLAVVTAAFVAATADVQVDEASTGMVVLFGVVLALMVLGVPIALCLVGGAIVYFRATGIATEVAVPVDMAHSISSYVLVAVPLFVLVGYLLAETGLAARLADGLGVLVGRAYGGLHLVQVLGVLIFSGLSGAKVADIVAIGAPLKDVLDEQGYPREETAAVLASSAAAGETVPPSIAMLILGSVTSVSITGLLKAGIIPAIVIAAGLMGTVWVRSRRRGRRRAERVSARDAVVRLLSAAPVALVPLLIVGGLVSGIATATEVSAVAIVVTIVGGLVLGRRGWWRRLPAALTQSASMAGLILFLVAAAGPASWAVTLSQVPDTIAAGLGGLRGSTPLFLIGCVVALMIFGSILEGLPAIIIFGPLLMPAATELGINPVHFGILLIVALGVGAFAPPIGVGFTVACATAGVAVEKATRTMLPYLAVKICFVLLVAFVPAITLALG